MARLGPKPRLESTWTPAGASVAEKSPQAIRVSYFFTIGHLRVIPEGLDKMLCLGALVGGQAFDDEVESAWVADKRLEFIINLCHFLLFPFMPLDGSQGGIKCFMCIKLLNPLRKPRTWSKLLVQVRYAELNTEYQLIL